MSDGRSHSGGSEGGPDLDELRSRLDALRGSVEQLGREEVPPAPAPQQPAPEEYYEAPPRPPYDHAAEVREHPVPPQPPAYPSYPPPPEPATEPYYEAPPAATNGGTVEDLELANVTILDAGPFADLIELRHFEEAVIRLDTVRDVRVRRFGHQRAKVEVGMIGHYAIGDELYRLGRPMQVDLGPDGEVIVDFTDVPAEPLEVEPEPEPAAAEPGQSVEAEAEGAEGDGSSSEDEQEQKS